MSIDISKLQLSATNSSLKLLAQGTGTLVVPAGSSTPGGDNNTEGTTSIVHGYGSTDLFWEVVIAGVGGSGGVHYVLPFWSAASYAFSHIDTNRLYVTGGEIRPSGVNADGFTTAYSYRIFIP